MKEKILILEDEIGIRSFVSINLKRGNRSWMWTRSYR